MKEKIEESIKSLSDEIKTHTGKVVVPLSESFKLRFNNPFFYNFALTWALFNWDRILVLAFSNKEIIERVKLVKDMPGAFHLGTFSVPYGTTIWLPIISTLLIVIASPFIHNLLDKMHIKPLTTKQITMEELKASDYNAQKKSKLAEYELLKAIENKDLENIAIQKEFMARTLAAEKDIKNITIQHNDITNMITVAQQNYEQIKNSSSNLDVEISEKNKTLNELESNIKKKSNTLISLESLIKKFESEHHSTVATSQLIEDLENRLHKAKQYTKLAKDNFDSSVKDYTSMKMDHDHPSTKALYHVMAEYEWLISQLDDSIAFNDRIIKNHSINKRDWIE
ncbi:hypothetical protein [Siccibacter colletis]|uniref:Uncharacterized protein n=1 Tax=Siccibacter colletis TaxID=1505757 RepID=A0ABY6JDJ3_9ENTR|nr:hypothetical protein [Siccibacter colletis]UYU30528.1 hypothetical protein KFZ77_11580 [Siccibacter colletis]